MNIYQPYTSVADTPRNGKFTPRPEQQEAIDKAYKYFSNAKNKNHEFLWNAKMRFGKTVCALWLIEKLNKELGKKKILIVTHRPVVNASWYGDFKHLFKDELHKYSYGTAKETDHENTFKDFYSIKRDAEQENKCVMFFASMQYLRLAKIIRGVGDDNSQVKKDILNYDWDLVIIDEAHEGTQTNLGDGVIKYLQKEKTFMLHLSGTPFNLLEKFKSDQIYNWDYIKEQQTKANWDKDHQKKNGLFDSEEVNPYRELPQMSIMTFRIGEMTDEQAIKDSATGKFSFTEFFRVKTGHDVPQEERGKFIHEEEVLTFLMTMWKPGTGYPFSTDEYRKFFRHTLWVVPGVKEAKALKLLIETKTPMPKWGFKVVNVAGNSEDDEQKSNALDKVFEAMKVNPSTGADDSDQTHTITISCGRLTTGVTVKPWTAVLYMKGSETTAASTYMQTIFRVQSPHTLHGMMKSKCYVFDFAPERALVMMAETAKYSRAFERKEKKGQQKSVIDKEDKKKMKQLIDTCPIYEMSNGSPVIVNGEMKPIDSDKLFGQLTSVYVDKVVRNGFDHSSLYNYEEFLKLNSDDEENLNFVSSIFDDQSSDKNGGKEKIDVNHQEYTDQQLEALRKEEEERKLAAKRAREEAEKKKADELAKLTPEEREAKLKEIEEEARKKKLIYQQKEKLTGLSKRIPLMMYGANVEDFEEVTLENFTDKRFIDDASWNEFMPNGVTRKLFSKLAKFYNADVFKNAGIRIRQLAREADDMTVEERIARIAQIFKWFKNPDKETVLTPWEVVNRHMSSTLGGYCFFEDDFKTPVIKIDKQTGEILETNTPRFVDLGDVTKEVFGDGTLGNIDELQGKINTKILEINSKTGLYPLYIAYSLYRHLLPVYANEKGLMADNPKEYSAEDEHAIWDEVVSNNLYVICNTKMAERITRRTLLGFRKSSDGHEIKLHVRQDNLIKRAKNDHTQLISDLLNEGYWLKEKMENKKIKFNAIVGNPPYQVSDGSGASDDAANPIYQEFVNLAKGLNSNYVSLIMPSKWMIGGKAILKHFRKEMMEDEHLSYIFDSEDSSVCFEGQHIDGGICFFLWDKNHFGELKYQYKPTNEDDFTLNRRLYEQGFTTIVRDYRRLSILRKTASKRNFTDLVSARKPFGIGTDIFNNTNEYKSYCLSDNKFENSVLIWGVRGIKGGARRVTGYVKDSEIKKNRQWINTHKLFISKAFSTDSVVPPEIIKAMPGVICSETFLVIGPFKNELEQRNCYNYMQTNFFRILLFFGRGTMQVSQEVFRYIPYQDFSEQSKINWELPTEDLDNLLFSKYEFNEIECQYINNIIKK